MAEALDLAKLLNSEQLRAATTVDGPLLVLAGAGSGKTRVLVHRIAHLVQEKHAVPREILAVTFTNKAAGEMRERLVKILGDGAREAWIGTFHSMAGRFLRMEGHRLGYDAHFSIYDADDSKRLIKRTMEALNIDPQKGASVSQVQHEIDKAKNAGLTPERYLAQAEKFWTPALGASRRVYPRYQDQLRRSNAMDFGDLLLLAVELFKHHPEALARFANRFQYVLVDEFQDTNNVQYELLKLLVHRHKNLMVVGDDDQSIYGWRGADIRNILEFPNDFPGAGVVKLERNYRSTGNILEAANAIIKKNRKRHKKTLFTDAAAGQPLGVALVPTGEDEANLVAHMIATRLAGGESAESFAILYRNNAASRLFEAAFKRSRIPYVIIGGTGFYERREVKDVLSYLRLLVNPASSEDFERVLNVPPRGIGEKTLERLREAGEKAGKSGAHVLDLPEEALVEAGLKRPALAKVRELWSLLGEMRALAATQPAVEVAKALIARVRYLEHLEESDPQTAEDRIANVEELVSSIAELEDALAEGGAEGFGLAGARTPLEAFLDSASLMSPNDEDAGRDKVSLLTFHGAKGLEFPVVFMVGMEDEGFPGRRGEEGHDDEVEEERRLCYVGVTRAMGELYLLAARYRRVYGDEQVRSPSRFLGDIPDTVVDAIRVGPAGQRGRTEMRGSELIEYDDESPRSSLRRREPPRRAPDPEPDDDFDDGMPDLEPDFDDRPPLDRGYAAPPRRAPASEARSERSERRGAGRTCSAANPRGPDGEYRAGTRVFHNTFGVGVVEAVDGAGPRAKLTIRFPSEGTKSVVARFVRPAE